MRSHGALTTGFIAKETGSHKQGYSRLYHMTRTAFEVLTTEMICRSQEEFLGYVNLIWILMFPTINSYACAEYSVCEDTIGAFRMEFGIFIFCTFRNFGNNYRKSPREIATP